MCGRYNIDFEASKELKKVLNTLNQKYPGNHLKQGEVFPTNEAAILIRGEDSIIPELSVWGYPKYTGKGVLINARAETAMEKKTFRESVISRRCVVPTTGFFEWDQDKKKYLFEEPGQEVLYLAGLYQLYEGVNRFVILTTAANASMEMVHQRMPVLLQENQMEEWLHSMEAVNQILHRVPFGLNKTQIG